MHALEASYWWYRALHRLVLGNLRENGGKSLRVLDAGCGTGRLLELLKKDGHRVVGVDTSAEAIGFCRKKGIAEARRADLNTFRPMGTFDAVTCMDVLYHARIRSEKKILKTFWRALRPGGRLILQVPAFPCLRGSHDEEVEGARRYLKGPLRAALAEAGFETVKISYRIGFLFFSVWVRRSFERMGFLKTGTSDLEALPAFIDTPLRWFANAENFFVRMGISFPFGVSLFAVARKPGKAKPQNETLSAFLRYLAVGLLNTALGYGAILASSHWLGFGYLWANVTGYAFGLANAFFWQKKWVFRSSGIWRSEILPFLAVFGVGFLLNLVAVWALGTFTALDKNLVQLAGIAVYTATNFLGNRIWTFAKLSPFPRKKSKNNSRIK